MTVSPDSKSAYVASFTSDAVAVFARDTRGGGAEPTPGSGTGPAPSPDTPYGPTRVEAPNPKENAGWAERLQTLRHLDDPPDGGKEILVGALREDIAQFENAGKVYVLNGADRSVRYELHAPEPSTESGTAFPWWTNFGSFIQALVDVERRRKGRLRGRPVRLRKARHRQRRLL